VGCQKYIRADGRLSPSCRSCERPRRIGQLMACVVGRKQLAPPTIADSIGRRGLQGSRPPTDTGMDKSHRRSASRYSQGKREVAVIRNDDDSVNVASEYVLEKVRRGDHIPRLRGPCPLSPGQPTARTLAAAISEAPGPLGDDPTHVPKMGFTTSSTPSASVPIEARTTCAEYQSSTPTDNAGRHDIGRS
jgi:hypothetical protein